MTDERNARAQVERWGGMVWRLALARTRHIQDSEDVFQEVFARFFRHEGELSSDEHRKAWLIRCTLNCTSTLLSAPWRKSLPLEEALLPFTRNVAEFLGLEHKGRIAPGCDADFLVLTDDLKIHEVWAKGRQMVREGVVCVKGTFE